MDLEFKGGNCVAISYKKELFVVDPKLSALGLKDQAAQASVQLLTQAEFAADGSDSALIVDGPGEYEAHNCSIRGIAAKRHSELDDARKVATIYRLDVDGISFVILGHVDPALSDEQLEAIGVADVLVVPVGNSGYTLDAKSAVDVVRKISPKIVIPTHYAEEGVTYEVPQQPIDEFLKELGAPHEELPKLKLKAGLLPVSLTVYQLTRSK